MNYKNKISISKAEYKTVLLKTDTYYEYNN